MTYVSLGKRNAGDIKKKKKVEISWKKFEKEASTFRMNLETRKRGKSFSGLPVKTQAKSSKYCLQYHLVTIWYIDDSS